MENFFLNLISGISKAEVVKWCLDHSFELIDMISEGDEDHEEGTCIVQAIPMKYFVSYCPLSWRWDALINKLKEQTKVKKYLTK